MSERIVQKAGKDQIGEFAPEFAHFNDDILFGESWNNKDIDLTTRNIITVVALMSLGITDVSLMYYLQNAKNTGVKHWHGAAPDSWFSHLVVEVPGENASNEWREEISDEQYGMLK